MRTPVCASGKKRRYSGQPGLPLIGEYLYFSMETENRAKRFPRRYSGQLALLHRRYKGIRQENGGGVTARLLGQHEVFFLQEGRVLPVHGEMVGLQVHSWEGEADIRREKGTGRMEKRSTRGVDWGGKQRMRKRE